MIADATLLLFEVRVTSLSIKLVLWKKESGWEDLNCKQGGQLFLVFFLRPKNHNNKKHTRTIILSLSYFFVEVRRRQ